MTNVRSNLSESVSARFMAQKVRNFGQPKNGIFWVGTEGYAQFVFAGLSLCVGMLYKYNIPYSDGDRGVFPSAFPLLRLNLRLSPQIGEKNKHLVTHGRRRKKEYFTYWAAVFGAKEGSRQNKI